MFKVEKDFEYQGHRCVVIFTDMGIGVVMFL